MADNRGLRYAGKEPETLSEDDPLAELARIAGEFAPAQARPAEENAAASSDDTFEFDLEAELLRSFGVEQPSAPEANADDLEHVANADDLESVAQADNLEPVAHAADGEPLATAADDEPADIPAFLRSRPSSDDGEDEPAGFSSAPASEIPAGEPKAEAEPVLPDPEPVEATSMEGREPEILEDWTDLPAWPAHRPNTAARGWEDAPDPSLGTFAADRQTETPDEAEPVAEEASAVEPSSAAAPEVARAAVEDPQAEAHVPDEGVGMAEPSYEAENAAEGAPEIYDEEHFAYADEAAEEQPAGADASDASADDLAAAEEEFVEQELALAGQPVEDDQRAEDNASIVPEGSGEEWDLAAATDAYADEEPLAQVEPAAVEQEPHRLAAIDDDPVWQDFEHYAVPERAGNTPVPTEAQAPEAGNEWDIADELDRAFAQFHDFRAAPAPLVDQRHEAPQVELFVADEPVETEFMPGAEAVEPAPVEIETFEPELEVEARPEEPAAAAVPPPVEDDTFDIDFDFDDLELEMQAEDNLGLEPAEEPVSELAAASEYEPAEGPATVAEPSSEETAYESPEPIPTFDLYWPVADTPSEPASAAPVAAAPMREDLVFDVHDVADTTAMVEPVGEIDIPELPVDDDPAARETVDPDLSDLEAEFAEILAAEPSAPAEAPQPVADLPEPEKPLANGHDKLASGHGEDGVEAIDFAQYDFADLGRRQPEFGMAHGLSQGAASEARHDASDDDLYFEDIDRQEVRPAADAGKKRKWILAGGAGVLLCGVAFATFFLTGGSDTGNGAPPVIAASDEPFKVVPEDRGGRAVPNQDQAVYEQVAGSGGEEAANLVSRSEQPVDVVQRTLDPQVLPLEGRPDPDTLAMVAPGEGAADTPAAPAQPAEDAAMTEELLRGATEPNPDVAPERFGLEPRRVETLIVRADGTLVPADSVQEEPAAAEPATAAEAPTPSERPEGATPSDPEARLQPADAGDDISAPVRSVQTTTLAPGENPPAGEPVAGESVEQAALAEPAATTGGLVGGEAPLNNPGGYVMQIASQPSEAGARDTYQNLLTRYQSILGGRQAQIQAAEIPDRGTFYRVRVAGGTRDEAVALCEQYQAAGGSCFVAR